MPSRILREGILTSPRMVRLGWSEEVFYRRLHSVVDDFGRYYADEGLLRAACYPRQLNKVSDSDIGKWLRACVDAALVRVYPAQDGERYLEVLDFGQQIRAKKSRFPAYDGTCLADDEQMLCERKSNAHLDVSVSEGVISKPTASHPGGPGDARFDSFWQAYPRKVGKDAARKAFDKRKPGDELLQAMLKAIAVQAKSEPWQKDGGQFIPHPSTWLNEGRWQDEGLSAPSVQAPEVWKPPPPMSEAERLAADEVRLRVVGAVKRIPA